MLSWRWGGAILVAVLAAGAIFVRTDKVSRGEYVMPARQPGGSTGLVLAGFVQAPGVALTKCQARCFSIRPQSSSTVHCAELDAHGRFEFTGLSDMDYCVEIVVRSNPALVVARKEHVRPGGDELLVQPEPVQVFGPEASTERDSR